jgi:hypothetical protein
MSFVNLVDFWRIGTEQWRVKDSRRAAWFYQLLGAADMHTRIRITSLTAFPVSFALGYWDVKQDHSEGNSFLVKAVTSAI